MKYYKVRFLKPVAWSTETPDIYFIFLAETYLANKWAALYSSITKSNKLHDNLSNKAKLIFRSYQKILNQQKKLFDLVTECEQGQHTQIKVQLHLI